ncbi:hypothetical protein M2271_003856 [Streptomyces sp. LBL]|uniref:hypothetical protein n=1 Tax=Streptomyces sp. LBL TaxID=2940562 RepID=UPI0024739677|nr:hypothetical protein [Streptomyces sp. LBL]MDH6626040.1 hypothetical protein [Streptomyces sp. LBL]
MPDLFIDGAGRRAVDERTREIRCPADNSLVGVVDEAGGKDELGPSGLAEYREAKHIWRNTAPTPQGWFA